MPDAATRTMVRDYFEALAARDAERLAPYLADDFDLMIYGPVDLFPFCGRHRGKARVLEVFRNASRALYFREYRVERMVIDGNQVAALVHIAAEDPDSGRVISWRTAQFLELKDGLVQRASYVQDTYDMAVQALGHDVACSAMADVDAVPSVTEAFPQLAQA